MWVKLIAQRAPKPDEEYKVFTLRPDRSWGTYHREHGEMVRTEGPGPRHSAESFHQSLVDEWR